MSSAKVAAAGVLVAMSLTACGTAAKPEAGSVQAAAKSKTRANDPRKKPYKCLQGKDIASRKLTLSGLPSLQIGTRPSGPTAEFLATPGAAQNAQIQGRAQGAEVIGAALVYPNQATDKLMSKVESCVDKGVTG